MLRKEDALVLTAPYGQMHPSSGDRKYAQSPEPSSYEVNLLYIYERMIGEIFMSERSPVLHHMSC